MRDEFNERIPKTVDRQQFCERHQRWYFAHDGCYDCNAECPLCGKKLDADDSIICLACRRSARKEREANGPSGV